MKDPFGVQSTPKGLAKARAIITGYPSQEAAVKLSLMALTKGVTRSYLVGQAVEKAATADSRNIMDLMQILASKIQQRWNFYKSITAIQDLPKQRGEYTEMVTRALKSKGIPRKYADTIIQLAAIR